MYLTMNAYLLRQLHPCAGLCTLEYLGLVLGFSAIRVFEGDIYEMCIVNQVIVAT